MHYQNLINEEQLLIESKIVQKVEDKIKYIEIFRNIHKPKIKETNDNDISL